MLFHSLDYLIFLPIVFALYWIVPHRYRWAVIMVSSYYFYMCWNPKYVLLFLLVTVASYLGGRYLESATKPGLRKLCVALVAGVCFGILVLFKYFNFLAGSIHQLLAQGGYEGDGIVLNLILPVGISFYTFQAMGYVVDVYRKDTKAEHHFGKYAAFISFFPQLVAGPIERSKNLLTQLKSERTFDYSQATYGLALMAWGYFKKLVIADTMALYVDKVYADLHYFHGGARLVAMIFFAIQIYCDFSGYTDIARGTAKLFGIELMENFRSPYLATSLTDFWRRWHISLSTWFKDYLYIPLGGNRGGKWKSARNLLITFLVSGVWHGASWTYLIWGGLHGGVQIFQKYWKLPTNKLRTSKFMTSNFVKRLGTALAVIINFVIVTILWAFFRAANIQDAIYTIRYVFAGYENPYQYLQYIYMNLGLDPASLVFIVIMLALLIVYDSIALKRDVIALVQKQKPLLRWSMYLGILVLIFIMAPSSSAEFIYFDF